MSTALFTTLTASAQAPTWQFRWQTGQVLVYRVEHNTSASEVIGGNKVEISAKLVHVKRWQVLDVDAQGTATVQLSLKALKVEIKSPEGETLTYDSTMPNQGTAQLREQMSKFVGEPLALLRVDRKGKVIEVKESKHGPASRFESEPPFVITLPDENPRANQTWERPYQVTLEPPQGTGEKFDAVQKYTCRGAQANMLVVAMTTVLKSAPDAITDQVPFLQLQPEGEVYFDATAGRLHAARLHIDKDLKDHQGEGSSYRFKSDYTEQYTGNQ
jgi:hypothetical protein